MAFWLLKKYIKLEQILGIYEPKPISQKNYAAMTVFIRQHYKATTNYYKLIFYMGLSGLFISVGLTLYILWGEEDKIGTLSKINQYPSALISLITMAFSKMEINKNRKSLYARMQNINNQGAVFSDNDLIVSDYKNWTWEEYKNTFKNDE